MQPTDELGFLRFVLGQEIPLSSARTAMAFEFLAVDICARRMHFEQRWFQNEEDRAWVLLEQLRNAIAAGNRLPHVQDVLGAELRSIFASLSPESALRNVYENLWLAFPPEPWVAAKEARSFHMSYLVRYSGCWIDNARSYEGKWFSRRLSWWLQEGTKLSDPLLAYVSAIEAKMPPDVFLEPPAPKA